MRYAKANVLWKNIAKRNHASAPSVDAITLSNLAGFKDDTFETENGFVCVCGGTGQGKTALLQLIQRALTSSDEGRVPKHMPARVEIADVAVKIRFAENEFSMTGAAGEYPAGVQLIDLWDRTFRPLKYFRRQNIEILKEGITPTEFGAELVEDISAACSKRYDKIVAFEVEAEDDEIIPFFEVAESSLQYDSLTMATGELSILYLAWALNRGDRGAIFLIEEPEAYLPPISHEHIVRLIAEAAYRRGLAIIFSTHSANIVDSVPEKNVLPLRREAGYSVVAKGPQAKMRALQRLGLRPQRKMILIVEDVCSQIITREMIGGAGANFWIDAEVVVEPNGESGIREFLRRIPKAIQSTVIIGVLDGDQAGKVGTDEKTLKLVFLPMTEAPEVALIAAVRRNMPMFSKYSGRERERVEDAIESAIHLDKHEIIQRLASLLGLSVENIIKIALEAWKSESGNRRKIGKFIDRILVL